ncbi:Uncharacterised protein [Streptococcus pneumoniae]|nr:Uncharacterised protein [Streptococcus pneumoniae]CKG86819.1 Uncharacterised protein [Streptococcus pneumoniae]CRH99822.1 Uncharacterised protein [Streptococcus pneumoniae]CVP40009.1 Uncharacterised protein [Streptococcus pneumoniae]CWL44099.1 Uncharacterised protein [Streptococcus pneumoniae]
MCACQIFICVACNLFKCNFYFRFLFFSIGNFKVTISFVYRLTCCKVFMFPIATFFINFFYRIFVNLILIWNFKCSPTLIWLYTFSIPFRFVIFEQLNPDLRLFSSFFYIFPFFSNSNGSWFNFPSNCC